MVALADLEPREPTASASRVLGMKGIHHQAQLSSLLLMVELESTLHEGMMVSVIKMPQGLSTVKPCKLFLKNVDKTACHTARLSSDGSSERSHGHQVGGRQSVKASALPSLDNSLR